MTNAERTKMLLIEKIMNFSNEDLFRLLYDQEDFYPFGIKNPVLICPLCTLEECACRKRAIEAGCDDPDYPMDTLGFCKEGYVKFFDQEYDEKEQALHDYFDNHLVDVALDYIPNVFHEYISLTSEKEKEIDKKIREELHKTVDTVFPPIPIEELL